jgi:hypothetical protein
MKLYNFFLLTLSLICTLSEALPAGGGQCVPVNADGASLRNSNGAMLSLFSNQIRVRVVQSYIEPSTTMPFGGIFVDVTNDYCLRIRVEFRMSDGATYAFFVGGRSAIIRTLIPRAIAHNDIIHVSIHDAF